MTAAHPIGRILYGMSLLPHSGERYYADGQKPRLGQTLLGFKIGHTLLVG